MALLCLILSLQSEDTSFFCRCKVFRWKNKERFLMRAHFSFISHILQKETASCKMFLYFCHLNINFYTLSKA